MAGDGAHNGGDQAPHQASAGLAGAESLPFSRAESLLACGLTAKELAELMERAGVSHQAMDKAAAGDVNTAMELTRRLSSSTQLPLTPEEVMKGLRQASMEAGALPPHGSVAEGAGDGSSPRGAGEGGAGGAAWEEARSGA